MRCVNCGRLSPDNVNVCKYCGSVFDESKPAENIEPNYQIAYETDTADNENSKAPKYFKSGWLAAVVAVAVVVLVLCKIF